MLNESQGVKLGDVLAHIKLTRGLASQPPSTDGQIYTVGMNELDHAGNCLETLPPGEAWPFTFEFSSLLDASMIARLELVPGYDSKEM